MLFFLTFGRLQFGSGVSEDLEVFLDYILTDLVDLIDCGGCY